MSQGGEIWEFHDLRRPKSHRIDSIAPAAEEYNRLIEAIRIKPKTIRAIEKDAYLEFLDDVYHLTAESRWRPSRNAQSEWLDEFASEYLRLVRREILHVGELVANWVLSHPPPKAIPSEYIRNIAFSFGEKLITPGFLEIWLAYAVDRSGHVELQHRRMPDWLSQDMADPHYGYSMPSPDSIPDSLRDGFARALEFGFCDWLTRLDHALLYRISLRSHVAADSARKSILFQTRGPRDRILIESYSRAEAAGLLRKSVRTIRRLIRSDLLHQTETHRVCADQAFAAMMDKCHKRALPS